MQNHLIKPIIIFLQRQACRDLLKPSKSHFQLFEKNAKETNVAALSMCDCKLIHRDVSGNSYEVTFSAM